MKLITRMGAQVAALVAAICAGAFASSQVTTLAVAGGAVALTWPAFQSRAGGDGRKALPGYFFFGMACIVIAAAVWEVA